MGNFLSYLFSRLKMRKDRNTVSQIEDFEKVKRVWQIIQKESVYYGFAISNMLFKNHPQYLRYFENSSIPDFVQEAKVKKKFSNVCDILCAIFINYYDKPFRRDYFLNYVAMVHKDMGLTSEDIKNFMRDLMEMLITELPYLMSNEFIAVQTKYCGIITEVLSDFMEQHAESMARMLSTNVSIKKCCAWNSDPESQIIYGFPLKYWLYKKRYWKYRRAMWASVEANMLNSTPERRHFQPKSVDRKRLSGRKRTKIKKLLNSSSSDADLLKQSRRICTRDKRISRSINILRLLSKRGKEERDQTKNNYKSKFSPMETIQEMKNDDDDVDVLKNFNTLTTNNAYAVLQEGTNVKIAKQTARERKRMRNTHIQPQN